MKTSLSILLPIYNGDCVAFVEELSSEAHLLATEVGLCYEIIVADDGSTDKLMQQRNEAINALPHCRYVLRGQNTGRAAIRNFLAQTAQYDWLLFLDSDMLTISDSFLLAYLERPESELVVDGGVCTYADSRQRFPGNLRCLYECAATQHFDVRQRQQDPYHDFHTANFLISRSVMLRHPFDERFRRYGYEDVLMGKQLKKAGIAITHIDNPVVFKSFESNEHFIDKTEEGLRTLHQFRQELRGYSRLLTFVEGIHLKPVRTLIRLWHRLVGPLERRSLCGSHPSLRLFKLYKLGYYLTLTKNDKQL